MSAIRQSLIKLDAAVNSLENSLMTMEQSMTGQQRDMFGNVIKKNKNKSNGNDLQAAVIAKRLDQAIEKVEGLLSEG